MLACQRSDFRIVFGRSGNDDIIRMLLSSGGRSSIGDTNRRSLTPLGEAIISGHAKSATLLLNEVRGTGMRLVGGTG